MRWDATEENLRCTIACEYDDFRNYNYHVWIYYIKQTAEMPGGVFLELIFTSK